MNHDWLVSTRESRSKKEKDDKRAFFTAINYGRVKT